MTRNQKIDPLPDSAAPPGILLAGGLSRRMGGSDKPLRAIGGRSLLGRVIGRLAPQCAGLVINANGDPARFEDFALPVIADSVDGFAGPLAGILAGLDWAAANRPNAKFILTAAADTPFLPRDLVLRLQAAQRETNAPIAVAASGGHSHHVVALWSIALREDLHRAVTEEKLKQVSAWISRYSSVIVDWPAVPFDPFFNINTPEDIAEAERIAALDGG